MCLANFLGFVLFYWRFFSRVFDLYVYNIDIEQIKNAPAYIHIAQSTPNMQRIEGTICFVEKRRNKSNEKRVILKDPH